MERPVMQRLIGAAVLGLLAIIFLPMLLQPDVKAPDVSEVPLRMPNQPEVASPDNATIETRELPLNVPGNAPAQGGVLGVPMTPVDAATGQAVTPITVESAPLQTLPIATTQTPPVAQTPPVKITPLAEDALPVKPVTSAQGEPSKTPPTAAKPVPKPVVDEKPAIPMPKPPRPADPPIAEKPPTKPAKLPEPAAAGNYSIAIGSFTNLENANALVAKLKAQRLPVQTENATVNGKPALKVRIGPYLDRASAEVDRVKADAIAGSASKVAASAAATEKPAEKTAQKTAEKPAPKPAASSGGSGSGFSVQLEALSVEAEAGKVRDRARSMGFNAFVKRVETEKGVLYSVRLGPVADRDAANKLRDDASQKLGKTGIVKSHP
jgi:DedD protein